MIVATSDKRTSVDAGRVALATFVLLAANQEERVSGVDPKSVELTLGNVGFSPGEGQALADGNHEAIQGRMRRG